MPNRAERRHPPKIDPSVAAKINAIKNGQKTQSLEDLPPLDPNAPNLDDLPPEIKAAAEKLGVDPDAVKQTSKLATGRRHAKYTNLEKELAALLCLPALPFDKMGDGFCATHFSQQGPMLAMQLTVYSESHKATYDTLVRLVQAGGIFTLSMAIGMYALPPILHHAGGPEGLKRTFGVPVPAAEHNHAE